MKREARSLPELCLLNEDECRESFTWVGVSLTGAVLAPTAFFPTSEIDNLPIERDPRFPIWVTVQFYKGTSNGVVSAEDMAQIHEQIARVYQEADYVGSLVIQGDTGRPTEYDRDSETERPFRFPWWPRR